MCLPSKRVEEEVDPVSGKLTQVTYIGRISLRLFLFLIVLTVLFSVGVGVSVFKTVSNRPVAKDIVKIKDLSLSSLASLSSSRSSESRRRGPPPRPTNAPPTDPPPLKDIQGIAFSRKFLIRESEEHEKAGRSWQRRELCEPYSPRNPAAPQHDPTWAVCRDATDLVAFEVPYPHRPLLPLHHDAAAALNHSSRHAAATAAEVDACRQRELRTAADVEAGIASENPEMLRQVATIKGEFQRRRLRQERLGALRKQTGWKRENSNNNNSSSGAESEKNLKRQKRKVNIFISFTMGVAAHSPDGKDERRLLVYSFMKHAVAGRDKMLFVTDNLYLWLDLLEPVSAAVMWERYNVTKKPNHTAGETTTTTAAAADNMLTPEERKHEVEEMRKLRFSYTGNLHPGAPTILSILPFVDIVHTSHAAQYLADGADSNPSNQRAWLLEGLINMLIHEEQAQKDDPAGFEYGHIITGDSRDIVFFGNCFDALEKLEKRASLEQKPWLLAVAEQYQLVDSPINRFWIASHIGHVAEFAAMAHEGAHAEVLTERMVPRAAPSGKPLPVICSGLYAAKNLEVMSAAVYAFRMLLEKVKNPRHGVDQGAWNVLMIHLPTLVDMSGILSPIIVDPLVQPFARHHIPGYQWHGWRRQGNASANPLDSGYLNCAGETYSLVHQFDRYGIDHTLGWEVKIRLRTALVRAGFAVETNPSFANSLQQQEQEQQQQHPPKKNPFSRPPPELEHPNFAPTPEWGILNQDLFG